MCSGSSTKLFEFVNDQGADFTRLGMTSERLFGEDHVSIDRDLKDAAFAGNQTPRAHVDFNFPFVQEFVRQPDGARGVVSSRAVFKGDVHQSKLHEHSFPVVESISLTIANSEWLTKN